MIEVMIVVVLLAITAAIAMPMVGDRADLKLAAATRGLMADVQYAQNLALAGRETVYVRFELDQYTLLRRVAAVGATPAAMVPLTHPVDRGDYVVRFNGTSASNAALRGVSIAKPSFNGSTATLAFDSLGAPFAFNETAVSKAALAARATLTLSCRGRAQPIYIEPYTGELSVP